MGQLPQPSKSLFRNPTFRLLFSAQLISLAGSGATTVGLALFAHQLVGGSSAATVIGNALMLRILAFLLFSQPAGVLADRANRKLLLILADLVRFVLMALFPFVHSVWQVYLMIFLINAATAFFTPTYDSTIPEVVGSEHYVRALSLSRIAVDMEAVLGPAVAGLLVSLLGLEWLFWFDAATYLISATLVWASVLPHIPKPSIQFSFRSLLVELTFGSRLLLRQAVLRRALLLNLVEAIAGAAAIVATVVYVKDVLMLGETEFVLAMAGLGFGSTVTALFLGWASGRYESGAKKPSELHGRRHRWTERALLTGGVVLGLILLPGLQQPPFLLFVWLWILNGVGQALIALSSSTLLAEHTKESDRGKAYAAHFALTHTFWLITYPAIGHGVSSLGAPLTFTIAGAICLIISMVAIISRKPNHDHMHR
ncbi:MFS transporter [Methylomonas sp. LL1]|uniref:MFS transporter n=1 Tax=Methylomonas sp. LL1 TaxID=2785785 RepID=UPI0018C3E5E9|nr:MFS transporter [Methylomonas sp. LL1]QPK61647.1 MFS transporter [Methylomonas sp. LL1]